MVKMNRSFIAIYIDLENIPGSLNIYKLLQDIILQHETEQEAVEPVFAVKMACGNSSSISKLRDQLKEENFEIRETPHLSRKKNRADLTITVAAFERLYLDNPTIDKFVFITNDSDFTVIMDVLRKYGKEVWLVAQEQESRKAIFNSCSDNILIVEDYLRSPKDDKSVRTSKRRETAAEPRASNSSPDNKAMLLLKQILQTLDLDRPYFNSQLGMKFRQIDKSFRLKKTKYKNFNSLVDHFVDRGILEKTSSDTNNIQVRIIDYKKLETFV